jgi:dUTP pyrophosphatase
MKIRIVNHSRHSLPSYETLASAGMDLHANLEEEVVMKAARKGAYTYRTLHRTSGGL